MKGDGGLKGCLMGEGWKRAGKGVRAQMGWGGGGI